MFSKILRAIKERFKQKPRPSPTPIPYHIQTMSPRPTPFASNSSNTPVPAATPYPSGIPYQHRIPVSDSARTEIPQEITYGDNKKYNLAQGLMENFDDIKEATNAASMLIHPMEMTNIPGEQERGINLKPNRGENPDFRAIADSQNRDLSWDRGLGRINSKTFADMIKSPWKSKMVAKGIKSWDDLNDPDKSLKMTRLVLEYHNWRRSMKDKYGNITPGKIRENPSWSPWYAARQNLRLKPKLGD